MRIFLKPTISILILCLWAPAVFADWVPLRISVDNVVIGDLSTDLNEKGDPVRVKGSDAIKLLEPFIQTDKVSRLRSLTEEDNSLTIDNLNRVGITTAFNEKELRMTFSIPLEMRAVKDYPVLFAQDKAGLGLYNNNYSGYLNLLGVAGYTTTSTPTGSTDGRVPLEGNVELVQNLNFVTFESTAHYLEFDEHKFERVNTSLVHDFEADQVRLRVGDYFTGVQGFQSTMESAGIQIQKQFNIISK